jgi:hypothetical protein
MIEVVTRKRMETVSPLTGCAYIAHMFMASEPASHFRLTPKTPSSESPCSPLSSRPTWPPFRKRNAGPASPSCHRPDCRRSSGRDTLPALAQHERNLCTRAGPTHSIGIVPLLPLAVPLVVQLETLATTDVSVLAGALGWQVRHNGHQVLVPSRAGVADGQRVLRHRLDWPPNIDDGPSRL